MEMCWLRKERPSRVNAALRFVDSPEPIYLS